MTDIAVSRPSTPSPLTDCASLVEIAACAGGEVGLELARGVRRLVGLGPDEPVVDPSTAGGLVAEWRLAPSLGDLCFGDRPLEEVPAEDLARTFAVDPETYRGDVADAKAKLTDQTIMLVGSAPSYAHGVIDPIEALAAIAVERDLWFHVDACMGGLLMPYLERLGQDVPRFDFRVEGVSSMSMDLHKYGYCPKGASIVLYRDRSLRRFQIYACSEWTGYTIVNATVQSSKSGGPVAAAWATMQRMGDDGYMSIAKDVKAATARYMEGIGAIPALRVMGKPDMTLIAFTSDEIEVFHLPDLMKKRGWYIQPQLGYAGHRENVHLTVSHSNVQHVDAFLADLRECVEEARKMPSHAEMAKGIAEAVKDLDPSQLDEGAFIGLLSTAGMAGVGVPEETASLNMILQALPRKLTKEILVHYLNHLFE